VDVLSWDVPQQRVKTKVTHNILTNNRGDSVSVYDIMEFVKGKQKRTYKSYNPCLTEKVMKLEGWQLNRSFREVQRQTRGRINKRTR
jgi:hypothetical protein